MALAAAALCGCSRVDVHGASIRGVAYVRVNDVIRRHPLYPQIEQLNGAIAAINLEATLPSAPLTAAQIAQQTAVLNGQMRAAQDRLNAIVASKREAYQQKEREADIAALKAANIDPAAVGIGAQMNATSQEQAQAAAQSAQRDFAAYQQSVVAQDSAAAQAIAQQLSKQADQQLRARAEQYQQDENDLSLRLAQSDATQRLALKTKLNNLAMDPDTRKSIAAQVSALDKKEADQVNALRARHAADLATFQSQVRARTNAAITRQIAAIQAQTNAKLSARRDQVNAQLRSLGGAPVAQRSIPADVGRGLAQIHQEIAAQFQADAQKAVEEYSTTKADLDQQFAALHGADVGATGAAAKHLRDLQKRHDDLQAQIQSQIQREAERLAKNMGFTVVFDNVTAANGGYDMTNDLIHDIESLHE